MDTAAVLNNLWLKIEKKLPRWVNIALIILIALTLAKLVWSFFDTSAHHAAATPSVTTTTAKPQPRPNYDREIAQMHIMGRPSASVAKKVEDAPDTTLNLKLLGVLAGGKEYGYAIISGGGDNIKHYALGDDVPGGATLHAVYPDRVILERDIRMETLRLPREDAAGFGKPTSTMPAKNTSQPQTSTNTDSFESLGQFRQEIMKNPVRLTEFINATPENDKDSGEFRGYKLTPSKNPDMFYQLGLQPGDVVFNINGIALDQPDKGPIAMQALVNAEEVTMTVMREGTEIQLFQDLR